MIKKIQTFIYDFSQIASIHGLVYLGRKGFHLIERILWTACICIAIYCIYSLAQRTWHRFQTSPMVITMDRNKFAWNTTFPSITICLHIKLSDVKVKNYISGHPEKFPNDNDIGDFKIFITKLSNLTYENMHELPMNNTFDISSTDWLDLIWNLSDDFQPEINSGTNKLILQNTITELGICYAVNSKISIYNSYEYWKNNRWDIINDNGTVAIHPLDGEVYAQMINITSSYELYFHGSMEVPDISKQRYTFRSEDFTTIELSALEIFTSENALDLSISQRACRFMHEDDVLYRSPIYSFSLCTYECRIKVALKICNCIPHFYRNKDKYGHTIPICNFDGLLCLSTIKDEIISLKSSNKVKIDCKCLENCDDSNFFVQSHRSRIWFLGGNLQWGIIDYPKMQLKRDLIFGFTDLLVNIGGIAGFFLGSSLLSFTEFIFFFTWKLFKYLIGKEI